MKRTISILLVAAILLSIPVMPVFAQSAAAEANITEMEELCPCGCGKTVGEVEWVPFPPSLRGSPPDGHLYLTQNYVQPSGMAVIAGTNVVVDLRGYTWTTEKNTFRALTVQGNFFLMDTVGGGKFAPKTMDAYGGAILMDTYENANPTFTLVSGTITMGAGSALPRYGFIYAREDSRFIMKGGVVENCTVQYGGGFLYTAGSATVEILGGVIRNCTAKDNGGAIYALQPVTLRDCTIVNCTATGTGGGSPTGNGGAIYATKGVNMENCTIMNCTAAAAGGAIYATNGLTMENCTVLNCEAGTTGGALNTTAALSLTGCQITSCTAVGDGGGIRASSTTTLTNTTVRACSSGRWGGGIAMAGGVLNATGSTLDSNTTYHNTSYANGGGNVFAMTNAKISFTNCTIKNGYTVNSGGNIYISGSGNNASLTLTGTTVTGGVAETGDNIRTYYADVIMDNAVVNGDMIVVGDTLTLKNATKINLGGAGLVLNANPAVTASELTDGAMIYVEKTEAGTVAPAGANPEYFRGAFRTVLSGGNEEPIVARIADDGEVAGYCPHCNAAVAWTAFTGTVGTNHYYLGDNRTANIYLDSGVDMVLDLNGKTMTSTGRAITNKGTMTVLDSGIGTNNATLGQWVGGKILGSGSDGFNGGVVHNNSVFKLYGGTIRYVKNDAITVKNGGTFFNYASGTFEMYGGILDGSAYVNTADTGVGATFCQDAGSSFTMTAGHMIGGSAYNGGTAAFDPNVTTTITGGTFQGGTAANAGGAMYFGGSAATGSVQVSNILVWGGEATASGGNISFGRYSLTRFNDCIIRDGTTAGLGGNAVMMTPGLVTLNNCLILDGTAHSGGNVGAENTYANMTFNSCKIYGGVTTTESATNNGGNLMASIGNVNIVGGELAYGKAGNSERGVGGNIACAATGKVTVKKTAGGEVPAIYGGNGKFGGNITVMGTVILTDAVINDGSLSYSQGAGKDIQISGASASLTVGSGLTGRISIWPTEGANLDYGMTISKTAATTLNEDLTIILEPLKDGKVFVKGGALYVGGAQTVNADGEATWHVDSTDAMAACPAGGYVKLYADANLSLADDTYVDLNGKTATISGSGKLLGMDSSGDKYDEPAGKAVWADAASVNTDTLCYAPNGYKYYAVRDGAQVTYHRLGAELTSVTLRPTEQDSGVYFTGSFGADQTVRDLIKTYGIAVSLTGMPTSSLQNCLYSTFQGTSLVNDDVKTGVLVKNIMKDTLDAATNNTRGRDEIYASTYVQLKDGTVLTGDNAATSADDVAYSLYDTITKLDNLITEDPTIFRRYTNAGREYYGWWKDKGMGTWLNESTTNLIEPERNDGVIDVLMIGSSSCYYYVEEMAALAIAKGIKLRVCNVYYSGCPINKYYEDWLANFGDYQFFDTTAEVVNGEIKVTRKIAGGGKTLEWCLAQGNWDVISMQSRGALVMRDYLAGVDHLEADDIRDATNFMFPYIKRQFPDAHLYLREQAAYQVGKKLSITTGVTYAFDTLEDQIEYAYAQKDASDRMVEKFNNEPYNLNMRVMPASQAMMLVREGFGQWEGYDQLCARIGFQPNAPDVSFNPNDPHEGDHGHVGDIGGGQYLEAALWLQVIMQNHYDADFDVRQIDWVPTYYYEGKVVENRFEANGCEAIFLREAAYKAAKEGWTPSAE